MQYRIRKSVIWEKEKTLRFWGSLKSLTLEGHSQNPKTGGLVEEKKAVIGWIRIRVITQKGKQCGFCGFWPMFNPYGLWVMEWWVYSFSFNNLTQKVLFFSVNILYEFNGKCNFLGNLLHRKNSSFLFFWTLKYTGSQIEKIKLGKLVL